MQGVLSCQVISSSPDRIEGPKITRGRINRLKRKVNEIEIEIENELRSN